MPIGLMISLVKKYLPQIIGVASALIALAYIHHKIDQGGYDRAAAEYQKATQRLLEKKNKEVDLINKQNAERSYNAAKTYADHASNFQRDVDNLTKRMSNSASRCRNAMPRTVDNSQSRERENPEVDTTIAATTIALANSCELWINQIPESE
ncbi:MAG: hypothetical protein K2Q14_04245 [Gammaproteobacteria bacterium]|nr:hypothetical protein [Nitrosomonas sp.]MBY0544741.1 hypothetical protein [Gammaproteobacteria bacterium]